MRFSLAVGLALVCIGLAVPAPAEAHPAAPPTELFRRQVGDCSDDWGGHSAVNDGHDLLAIDVTERYLASANADVVVLRVILNGGFASTGSQGGPLRDTISISSPTKAVTTELLTQDNKAFTAGTGAALVVPVAIGAPQPQIAAAGGGQDGARFFVEMSFTYDSLGAKVGDKLTSFHTQGYAKENKADYMPGGVYSNGVYLSQCPGNSTTEDAYFAGSGYTLVGSGAIDFKTTWDAAPATTTDGMAIKSLGIQSSLKKMDQTITLKASLPAGWTVMFMPSESFALAKDAKVDAMVHLMAGAGAQSGGVGISMTSDAGGLTTLATSVTAPPPASTATSDEHDHTHTPAKGKSPSADLASLLAALGVAVILRRR